MELVRGGNKELYAHIIQRYQFKLMRYALYLVGDHDKASDAVQESFVKAYVNLNGFDTKKKFTSWIYRIVHNEVVNLVNKHSRYARLDSNIDFNDNVNIEDSYIKEEAILHAQECLKQMDLIYREPLSLYYIEDKSYDEIGYILRLPPGTVATRINRAKVIMRKLCQAQQN